jgi:hypothetical protein
MPQITTRTVLKGETENPPKYMQWFPEPPKPCKACEKIRKKECIKLNEAMHEGKEATDPGIASILNIQWLCKKCFKKETFR